jgi:hypothetical protein
MVARCAGCAAIEARGPFLLRDDDAHWSLRGLQFVWILPVSWATTEGPEKRMTAMFKQLACVLLLTLPAMAQSFSFKGNSLGMSLEEFQRANATATIWINTGDPHRRRDKKLSRQVPTPLCSDEYRIGPVLEPGEVYCDASPGAAELAIHTRQYFSPACEARAQGFCRNSTFCPIAASGLSRSVRHPCPQDYPLSSGHTCS